jgi:hypothetical protein
VDACTGDRGADIDEGGVGTPRNCCSFSRRMEISLFASVRQLSHCGIEDWADLGVHPSVAESQSPIPHAK